MDKIKILIVDDHPMMREALSMALAGEPDMQIVAEASNATDGIALALEKQPDVVLMDLLMPGKDGIEAIRELSGLNPNARILVITSLEDGDKILAAIQAGALGYFPKTTARPFLLEAIRKVAAGIPYLTDVAARKLFDKLHALKSTAHHRRATDEPLTGRQEQILALVGEGLSDSEISKRLHLEEPTVRSHVHNIQERLGLTNRAQVVAYINRSRKKAANA